MIRKLKLRFIFINMACVSFIFILILLALNLSMTLSGRRQGYALLREYAQRMEFLPEGNPLEEFPPPKREFEKDRNEWLNDMRISYVCYDGEGKISHTSVSYNPDLTEDILIAMADSIDKTPNAQGFYSGYLYLVQTSEEETQVYFLDFAPERATSLRLLWICLWIGLFGILIMLIPIIFLSRWISKPVQQAFDKQKQFIADASHELKTPLTIITTNAEVLESTLPDNKWLTHILEQSDRMKVLINNLFMYGNENSIRQLITILLDNAFKYSEEEGTVSLQLCRHNDKKELLVRNTGKGISSKDQKHIFERFYRCDSSRSRQSGGYGLGLSIAQSITRVHKGHIRVKSDGASYTAFSVLLP